jgi:septal ring factor EnvC (AmiA/AmiB activator)
VLQILRKKDDQVESLQRQLDERTRALQAYSDVSQIHADQQSLAEGKSRDYWTGRSLAPETGMGSTHRELVDLLEQTRKQLESERQAHQSSRNELNNAYSTIEERKTKHRLLGADSVGSGRFQPQDWKELRGLREQTLDQAEQIKVTHIYMH